MHGTIESLVNKSCVNGTYRVDTGGVTEYTHFTCGADGEVDWEKTSVTLLLTILTELFFFL